MKRETDLLHEGIDLKKYRQVHKSNKTGQKVGYRREITTKAKDTIIGFYIPV